MTDQDLLIELEPDDTQGHATLRVTDDDGWLKDRAGESGSTRITLKAIGDTEGHEASSTVTLRAFGDDDDTEGHAISVHFPSREEADAFRRRLMLTGVLAGTIAVGAVAGIGVANLPSDDASTGAAAGTVAGMEWSQADERPDLAAGAAAGAADEGMSWSQAERPGTAAAGAAAAGTAEGSDWSQVERPGTATGIPDEPTHKSDTTAPRPE